MWILFFPGRTTTKPSFVVDWLLTHWKLKKGKKKMLKKCGKKKSKSGQEIAHTHEERGEGVEGVK